MYFSKYYSVTGTRGEALRATGNGNAITRVTNGGNVTTRVMGLDGDGEALEDVTVTVTATRRRGPRWRRGRDGDWLVGQRRKRHTDTSERVNTANLFRAKNGILMVVSKAASLFHEAERKTCGGRRTREIREGCGGSWGAAGMSRLWYEAVGQRRTAPMGRE